MSKSLLAVILSSLALSAFASSRPPVAQLGELPWFMGNYEDVPNDLNGFWKDHMSKSFAKTCLGEYSWALQDSISKMAVKNILKYAIYQGVAREDLLNLMENGTFSKDKVTGAISRDLGPWLVQNAERFKIQATKFNGGGALYRMDNAIYNGEVRDFMFVTINQSNSVEMFMISGEGQGEHNCGRPSDDLLCVIDGNFQQGVTCGTFDDT